MKKILIAALLVVSFSGSAFATGGTDISQAAISSFKYNYTDASDITWSTAGEYAKVSFVSNQERMEAFYSSEGDLIGVAKGVTLEMLPVNAKRAFAKKYADYTVTEAIKYEGVDENAYFISAVKGKETVILKVSENTVSTYRKQ